MFTLEYSHLKIMYTFNEQLEKEMVTRSSILAWEILWPGRVQSMGSQNSWPRLKIRQKKKFSLIFCLIVCVCVCVCVCVKSVQKKKKE